MLRVRARKINKHEEIWPWDGEGRPKSTKFVSELVHRVPASEEYATWSACIVYSGAGMCNHDASLSIDATPVCVKLISEIDDWKASTILETTQYLYYHPSLLRICRVHARDKGTARRYDTRGVLCSGRGNAAHGINGIVDETVSQELFFDPFWRRA